VIGIVAVIGDHGLPPTDIISANYNIRGKITRMPLHAHLPHLSRIWSSDPIYFITTCTHNRKAILANSSVAQILIDEWRGAVDRHGWLIGRYVIMPDHVHFFCSSSEEIDASYQKELSKFMQQWKQWTSKRIIRETKVEGETYKPPIWQKEFFDHLMRSEESYRQKWEYVRENPVRKNMVSNFKIEAGGRFDLSF
jgi:REP element-mobilizing transposase RayT